MSKEQKKYLVIREYTESDIKSLGMNYVLRKQWKQWIIMFVLSFGWMAGVTKILGTSVVNQFVAIAPVCIVVIAWYWSGYQVGKKIFNKVKDTPQPIKLDL